MSLVKHRSKRCKVSYLSIGLNINVSTLGLIDIPFTETNAYIVGYNNFCITEFYKSKIAVVLTNRSMHPDFNKVARYYIMVVLTS